LNHNSDNLPPVTFGQWIRGGISLLIFAVTSQIFTLLLFLPPPPYEKERRWLYKLLLWAYAKFVVLTHLNIRTKIINEHKEKFTETAIMIANHQSILDVPMTIMLSQKILIVTNDWARNPTFHFFIGKYIEVFPISRGLEYYIDELKKWLEKDYQILIFPEGVRWGTGHIERFHKGAFYLAEKLAVDILPLVLHGSGTINSSRRFYLKSGKFTVKILPRIFAGNHAYGSTYQERTKNIRQLFRDEYRKLGNY
jgi:uncharacterized protein